MGGLKFIHAADLHLGTPFQGVKSVEPRIGERLAEATFKALDNIVDACIQNQVDFLLVAGDVFDAEDRSLGAQLRFRNALSRLAQNGICSFVVYGNHDPLSGWSTQLSWPEQVKIFSDRIETVPFVKDGKTVAHIQGISHASPNVRDNLASRFTRPPDSAFAIGLLHANVGTDTGHEPYAPCSIQDLEQAGLDYWALGHVHKRQALSERNPAVIYPGNPQGLHINEPGAHGVYLVTVRDREIEQLEFLPMDLVRWNNLTGENSLDLGPVDSEEGIHELIDGKCAETRESSEGRSAILRMELTGRTPFHHVLRRENYMNDLVENLRLEYGAGDPFLWIDRIKNSTRRPLDREERKAAGDFVSELLVMNDQASGDPEELKRISEEALSPLYQSYKDWPKEIKPPEGEALQAICREAETLLLDLLIPEDTE